MPAKLSPEERDRRKKERSKRSFSDAAYRHYDPNKEGFGSSDQWQGAAEARLNGTLVSVSVENADLVLLGLDAMPTDLRELHLAYRKQSRTAHADAGGSDEAFRALSQAYERLTDQLRRTTVKARSKS